MADKINESLLKRWEPVLDGIKEQHVALTTAKLLENQAKAFLAEKMNEEAIGPGTTTVGKLGTFQKWAFPMIRRIFPELLFNKIGATQAMEGPVSQVFYQGYSRVHGATIQTVYSMFRLTYRDLVSSKIGSFSGADSAAAVVAAGWQNGTNGWASGINQGNLAGATYKLDVTGLLDTTHGSPSTTVGGQIASWPDSKSTLGWNVSGGERLRVSGIPEVTMHIQKQTVQARTRKMRALWTLEAAQDLKAYHNMDLENELTELLTKELTLEIDRELIEDIRMIAYGFESVKGNPVGGWYLRSLFNGNADSFPEIGGLGQDQMTFTPSAFTYDWGPDGFSTLTGELNGPNTSGSNVFVMDLGHFVKTSNNAAFAPQHLGHAFANVLALINYASQDIYRTTWRGPGTVLITSPLIASLLESAAKLEGGIPKEGSPTNMGTSISYAGKFMGKYDMIVDPLFPEDEIIVGYKGSGNMDAGFIYCPYIPLMPLQTVTDPETFQPRKGILTRYGKLAIQPASRYYRVIRLVGLGVDFANPALYRQGQYYGQTGLAY